MLEKDLTSIFSQAAASTAPHYLHAKTSVRDYKAAFDTLSERRSANKS